MLALVLHSLYKNLLKLYPLRFREAFGGEMGDVFHERLGYAGCASVSPVRRRVIMIGLFLREIWSFPLSYLDARRYQLSLNSGEAPAGAISFSEEGPRESRVGRRSSWGDALLGAIPFLLFGLAYYMRGFAELNGYLRLFYAPLVEAILEPYQAFTLLSNTVRYAPVGVYFLVALGTVFGVSKGFPRWAFTYLGMTAYFGWNYANGRYYGVVYGRWAWLPLLAAILLGLLLARSLRPLARFLQGCWNDWTRLSLALYAFAVPLFTIVFFEDDWGPVRLYELLFDTLLLAAGAVAFLRSHTTWGRLLSLEAVVLILVAKGMFFAGWLPIFDQELSAVIRSLFVIMVIYFGFLLLPAVIGLVKRGVNALIVH